MPDSVKLPSSMALPLAAASARAMRRLADRNGAGGHGFESDAFHGARGGSASAGVGAGSGAQGDSGNKEGSRREGREATPGMMHHHAPAPRGMDSFDSKPYESKPYDSKPYEEGTHGSRGGMTEYEFVDAQGAANLQKLSMAAAAERRSGSMIDARSSSGRQGVLQEKL